MEFRHPSDIRSFIRTLSRVSQRRDQLSSQEKQDIVLDFEQAQEFALQTFRKNIPGATKSIIDSLDMFGVFFVEEIKKDLSQQKNISPSAPSSVSSSEKSFLEDEKILSGYLMVLERLSMSFDKMSPEDLQRSLDKINDWEKRLPISLHADPKKVSPQLRVLQDRIKQQGPVVEKMLKNTLSKKTERPTTQPSTSQKLQKRQKILNRAPKIPSPSFRLF